MFRRQIFILLLLEKNDRYFGSRGGARNFHLGGPICVANLLVYTNFYTHTKTHVSIHIHKKLVSFIMNP